MPRNCLNRTGSGTSLPPTFARRLAFWLRTVGLMALLGGAALAQSGALAQNATPLAAIRPQSAWPYSPGADVEPRVIEATDPAESQVQLAFNSRVTYAIPRGARSFSGRLVFHNPRGIEQDEDLQEFNRVRVRFLADDRVVWEARFDYDTPPREFALDVAGAHLLTLDCNSQFGLGPAYLTGAVFSGESVSNASHFSVPANQGFVDFMPEARQIFFRDYRPGETVIVGVYFGGDAAAAEVRFELTPENAFENTGDSTQTVVLPARLSPAYSRSSFGEVTWKAPALRGPASLRVEEYIGNQLVFARTARIAVAPAVDLANISDSPFGVHLSGPEPLIQDDFAGLWGAKWGRVFLRWPVIETSPGNFDFSRVDPIVGSYLAQHMRVLGVLGEDAPPWAMAGSDAYLAAWKRFVAATVAHFHGRISYWDEFNEPDSKFFSSLSTFGWDSDMDILKDGVAVIHSTDSNARIVCCSLGTSDTLGVYRRMISAGVLVPINMVSIHPYWPFEPEARFGYFSYLAKINALQDFLRRQGVPRPVWATEANWILGPRGGYAVTAPGISEHQQAEYLVRTNLLSFSEDVPYFAHMPFFYTARPQLHLDTLAAYSQMASWFSGAGTPRLLVSSETIYCVTGVRNGRLIGAAWSSRPEAVVSLSGLAGAQFTDMYGNPVSLSADSISLSASPIYFSSRDSAEVAMNIIVAPPDRSWSALPPLSEWKRSLQSTYAPAGAGLHITSGMGTWANQLSSPAISVDPDSCYRADFDVGITRGDVAVVAVAADTGEHLPDAMHLYYVDGKPLRAEMRVHTLGASQIKFGVQDANGQAPAISEFTVAPVGMAPCD